MTVERKHKDGLDDEETLAAEFDAIEGYRAAVAAAVAEREGTEKMTCADRWGDDDWIKWMDPLREAYRAGKITKDVIAAIEMIPDWTWTNPAYEARRDVNWLKAQHLAYEAGTLTMSQIAELTAWISPDWIHTDAT